MKKYSSFLAASLLILATVAYAQEVAPQGENQPTSGTETPVSESPAAPASSADVKPTSILLGSGNLVSAASGIALGTDNVVGVETTSEGATAQVSGAAAMGQGLISGWSNSLLVGKFNDSAVSKDSGLLFAIGNGKDAENRSNAFEVYSDGTIRIPCQGDILMGKFGAE